MARNASGTYSLPAGNPVVTATLIASAWANTTMADLAAETTDSLSRSGKGGMLAPLLLADGALGTPALSFTSEPSSGLFRAAANDLRLSVAGAERASFSTKLAFTSGLAAADAGTDFDLNTTNARTAGFLFSLSNNGVYRCKFRSDGLTEFVSGTSAAFGDADFVFDTRVTRIASNLLDVRNLTVSKFSVNFAGNAVLAGTLNSGAITSSAGLTATTGTFSGAITSSAGLTATTGTFSGAVSASALTAASLTALAVGALSFTSNLAAGSASTDHTLNSANTRTAGNLLAVTNNASARVSANFDGILKHGLGLVSTAGSAPIRVNIAADVTNSAVAIPTDFGPAIALKSGKTYRVRGHFRVWAAATTTGLGISIKATGLPTSSASQASHDHWTTVSTFLHGSVSGFADLPSTFSDTYSTTSSLAAWDEFNAFIVTTSTGTLQFRLRTEVEASVVTLGAGSWFEITED